MDYFLSYKDSNYEISYLFNKNHFLILFLSLVIIIFFSMYFSRQKFKTQKIAMFFAGLFLLGFEISRIIWNYNYLKYNNLNLTFINITNLDLFTLSMWISIPLILINSISIKKDTKKTFGLDFVYSVASLFAIITLIYPININTNFEFYNCVNVLYILERSFILMSGFVFVLSKWISVKMFLDLWKAILSLLIFWIICIILGFVLNFTNNLFYLNNFPLFDELGIHLAFPLHLIVLNFFVFTFQIFLYLPFRLHEIKKFK